MKVTTMPNPSTVKSVSLAILACRSLVGASARDLIGCGVPFWREILSASRHCSAAPAKIVQPAAMCRRIAGVIL
ncbi:hypothetical protein [Sphingomonas sp. LH128]|uniref:hypothetical protein n=1 Tax=Sphingomonas sp. LH128 TaxID=473781 RepID=UPI002E1281BF